ncbi:MAG: cobalt ECF transporter T component CbiQ [Ilumatobacteraceae bacterium]
MSLGDRLYLPGDTPIHRLAPEAKLLGVLVWVFAVVSTPRHAFWAFAIHAAVALTVASLAGLPPHRLARRLVVEVPFVAFAVLLLIVGRGERTSVLGVSLSVAGLWAAWNILAKATLGVVASVVLASTTPVPRLLRGLERLRVPSLFVAICGFMVRYADVLTNELHRMRIARISRGDDPRWIWQARAVAGTAGALFVRSYERGERVHLAMLSRGFDGRLRRSTTAVQRVGTGPSESPPASSPP